MKPRKIRQHGWHGVNKQKFLQEWNLRKPWYLLRPPPEEPPIPLPKGLDPKASSTSGKQKPKNKIQHFKQGVKAYANRMQYVILNIFNNFQPMKNKVYILGEILSETQARFPHIDLRKFKILYDGWRQQGIRAGRKSQFYSMAWKRGWISTKDADSLRKYIGIA